MEPSQTVPAPHPHRDHWPMGLALIALGLLALIGYSEHSSTVSLLFLPAFGAIFLVWGMADRNPGLLVPGGVMTGVGLGPALLAGPLAALSGTHAGDAVFPLSLALGFGCITLLSARFTAFTHWWALIPGSILAAIGLATLVQGAPAEINELVAAAWPLGLIGLGLAVLLQPAARSR
jgi:hypothetical protein